jgi:hypothetical protein
MIKCKVYKTQTFKINLNPLQYKCSVVSSNKKINCSLTKQIFRTSINKNKLMIQLGRIEIGNAHNHNDLYYQKEEAQEKLIYIPNYKMFLVN